jgi:hypothetical protein
MSDFEPTRESIQEILNFDVLISKFENNTEQRRLKNENKVVGFKITTPALTKAQMQTYRTFFITKYGALEQFTFTSPFDDTEYNVRFEPDSFQTTYSIGVFTINFELKIVY